MWGGKSRSGSDLYFFIYDEYAMKSEYDTLEEAVMYYQPKNVSRSTEMHLVPTQTSIQVFGKICNGFQKRLTIFTKSCVINV